MSQQNEHSYVTSSVADPDPHVFGPPGSGSGSGSFYHEARIVRKTLISAVLWLLFDFLSLKNDVKVPSKSNMQKNIVKKICFFLASWRSMMKIEGSWSISQMHGSAYPDPDPLQNVMDPQHWLRDISDNTTFKTYPMVPFKETIGEMVIL